MLKRNTPLSLQTILSWVTVLVITVALMVATALVVLTSLIHRTSASLAAEVEGVRLAQQLEIHLLLHSRSTDPLVREDLAGDLTAKLAEAAGFVISAREADILGEAARRVDEYLTASQAHGDDTAAAAVEQLRTAAFAAIQDLVDINVADARTAEEDARRWDVLANTLGISATVLLVLVAGVLLWWLRTRAFRPLVGIMRAMQDLERGDRGAHAEESGPPELRNVALRFNQMVSSMATQRQAQMAFLGGVAHDLRNPLNVLRIAVSALDRGSPLSEARTRKTLEIVARQTTQLERMVGDFLDIARIEAGDLELKLQLHDPRKLVRDAAEMFIGQSQLHPIELALAEEVPSTRCDPLRIEQAVVNLISNAIKYSPGGGAIRIGVAAAGDEVVISVADSGLGMAEADQRRIFEPFTRVGLSRESIPGSGLGLYVVRKIVLAHAGRIEVESSPGRGSTFRLFLPATAAPAPADEDNMKTP